jgi:putative ABC transport system ATP-binding protein
MLLNHLSSVLHMPTKSLSAAVSARGVGIEFHLRNAQVQVLQGIDITVNRGDIHLLMGPSGSGKTTLLSILAGVLHPTEGCVTLLGQEITCMSRSQLTQFRLANIGFIFQSFNLFPALTAVENVEVTLNLKGLRRKEARAQAQWFLEQVGMANHAHQRPGQLSGGQQQRVAIARAIASDPQILMADEPTAALDARNSQSVIELLSRVTKERQHTLVMVTHDQNNLYIADQVTYLEDGKLKG